MSNATERQVWSRFERERDGKPLKLCITDFCSDYIDQVVNLNINYFVKEETILKSIGADKNTEAKKECEEMIRQLLNSSPRGVVVCCIDDDLQSEPYVVGVSIMQLVVKPAMKADKMLKKFQTPEVRKSFEIFSVLESLVNVTEEYSLNSFYDDRGIVVHPDYRRLGISKEFFKIRQMMCKEHNVPMTGAWMTSIGSQKAAKKAGWKTIYEISWEELGRKCDITFKNSSEICKYMIANAD